MQFRHARVNSSFRFKYVCNHDSTIGPNGVSLGTSWQQRWLWVNAASATQGEFRRAGRAKLDGFG
jgi:hypothetical protein